MNLLLCLRRSDMCCLFGLLDYGHSLTAAQKNHILAVLSTVCEARGTDATGIA